MYKDITGVILAGGKSIRMGEDKAFLTIQGKTVIEFLYRKMTLVFERVAIIANEPEKFRFLHSEIYSDVYPNMGPLSGMHSALVHSATQRVFVIPCDAPLLTQSIMERMISLHSPKPITYCKGGGFTQHLIGIFDKILLPDMETILCGDTVQENGAANANCNIGKFIADHDHDVVEFSLIEYPIEFLNLNSPTDFEQLQTLLK